MLARVLRWASRAGLNAHLEIADIEHLPYRDESFGIITAACVFCSVGDPVRGLREAARVCVPDGAPYESVIRFTGLAGNPSPADWFELQETVRLVPGSGPVAVTARVEGVSAGEWLVRARLDGRRAQLRIIDPGGLRNGRLRRPGRILWTKGNPVAPAGPATPVRTRAAALANAPGIITSSWAAFVVTELAAALAVLVVLLARAGVGDRLNPNHLCV